MTIQNKQYRKAHCVDSSRNLSEENRMSAQNNWNMKKSLAVILAVTPLVLVGCGGGGGGGGSASTPSPATPSTPAAPSTPVTATPSPVTSAVAAQSYTMSDLVVPDGFDYSSVEQFDLDIDISSISTDRSFVTVYSRFSTRGDSTLKPDYSSKVIAGPLDNGVFASNFAAPVNHEALLIEIWFYDGQPPLQQVVSSGDSQIVWQ
ncbi:Lipoprotein [Vibrio crassostreae]|nr:Lipoprotein [Vibrio crassostreae]CAK3591582.1 Lipoprotein [Vibrio crassostreae]CAK3615831.1 Lipoprotein [Vibrio crassostreae]CAK3626754.1 Lipoprotein [Vibrio crassostreae]CAK3682277.1 Lipoprotein [Vibrio crassostreae]